MYSSNVYTCNITNDYTTLTELWMLLSLQHHCMWVSSFSSIENTSVKESKSEEKGSSTAPVVKAFDETGWLNKTRLFPIQLVLLFQLYLTLSLFILLGGWLRSLYMIKRWTFFYNVDNIATKAFTCIYTPPTEQSITWIQRCGVLYYM